MVWILLGSVVAVLMLSNLLPSDSKNEIPYTDFRERLEEGEVTEGIYDNTNGDIDFTDIDGIEFKTTGPTPLPDADIELINENVFDGDGNPAFRFETPTTGFFTSILPLLLPVALLILFFWWMQRRAQGQMGSIMSIGRSRAKTYSSERPGTTFDVPMDVNCAPSPSRTGEPNKVPQSWHTAGIME